MNIKKRLLHLAQKAGIPSGYGKTSTIIKACKELDGILLVATREEVVAYERQGVTAKLYDTNLDGFRGPFFFDHKVVEKLLKKAASKIEELEEKAAHYEIVKGQLSDANNELQEVYNNSGAGWNE